MGTGINQGGKNVYLLLLSPKTLSSDCCLQFQLTDSTYLQNLDIIMEVLEQDYYIFLSSETRRYFSSPYHIWTYEYNNKI